MAKPSHDNAYTAVRCRVKGLKEPIRERGGSIASSASAGKSGIEAGISEVPDLRRSFQSGRAVDHSSTFVPFVQSIIRNPAFPAIRGMPFKVPKPPRRHQPRAEAAHDGAWRTASFWLAILRPYRGRSSSITELQKRSHV